MPSELTKQIETFYHDRDKINTKVKFWRHASSSNLDEVKWDAIARINQKNANVKSDYLFRYEFRSDKDFLEQSALSNDNGFSEFVIETYLNHWANVKYDIEIAGFDSLQLDQYLNNIDGVSSTSKNLDLRAIEEVFTVGEVFEFVDSDENGRNFFVNLVKRENVRNFAKKLGHYEFVTWDATLSGIVGFSSSVIPIVYAWDKDNLLILRKTKNNEYVEISGSQANNMDYVPFYSESLGSKCLPIINVTAKLQLNLYNLDSEWRKIIRDQGGLNFITAEEGSQFDYSKIGDRAMLLYPHGANAPSWVSYPANSFPHAEYEKRLLKVAEQQSKIRMQNSQESGIAKSYDFFEASSVMKRTAKMIESLNKKRIEAIAKRLGKTNYSINIVFDEDSFKIDELNKKVEILQKLQTLMIPDETRDDIMKRFLVSSMGVDSEKIEKQFNRTSNLGDLNNEI